MQIRWIAVGISLACAFVATPTWTHAQETQAAALQPDKTKKTFPCNDDQFLQDQQAFQQGEITDDQPVDVCGTVTKVLPAKHTTSGKHGYFYLQVSANKTIEIVSDLDQMNAPSWPWVKVGDAVTVRGRYYYDDASSQGIDWTHHGTSSSWPQAGYVVVNGTEYQ